jgi:hypothetical protein
MSTAQLREMIEHASTWAQDRFAETGAVRPMWHVVKANGEHAVVMPPSGDKDTSVAIMRAFFELNDVVCCLFIDEAWTATGGGAKEWIERGGTIADFPNRVEVIAFMGEDSEGGMMVAHRRIIRETGKPTLAPLEFMDHQLRPTSQGRLVGMLPRRTAKMQ